LRDKLSLSVTGTVSPGDAISDSRGGSDVLNALLSLGYNDREAKWAVRQLAPDIAVSDGIRQALKLLSKDK
jgi:Holliday junction DNA helicase RuvA